jgi:hypothetical protein
MDAKMNEIKDAIVNLLENLSDEVDYAFVSENDITHFCYDTTQVFEEVVSEPLGSLPSSP